MSDCYMTQVKATNVTWHEGSVSRGEREQLLGQKGVNVWLTEAEKRDPKGLYKKARAGQLKGFTGIDDPYEAPERPEIVIETESTKPDEAAKQILAYLQQKGCLTA